MQSIAEPGGIVVSYETYALVRDFVRARPLPAIRMKGISREVIPYAVEGLIGEAGQRAQIISEHEAGLDIFLDTEAMSDQSAERAKNVLKAAIHGERTSAGSPYSSVSIVRTHLLRSAVVS